MQRNNTGFTFTGTDGRTYGHDHNGTPTVVNTTNSNIGIFTTNPNSYNTNSNIGSFTTNPTTYNNPSIGTIIGGLNNTVPTSYVSVTNPYITQSSTFPTFTPPVFQTPITKPIQSENISKINQNTSISYTSPMQNTQTKIINEFVSKYGSGMNEANVGILLKNIKSISGGEVTGQSKELVKQVYSTWFQSNFGMDTANIKIFNDRCISIFGKPIEIGAFKSTEDLHGSIVSKFTSEYGMDAPNTGILLNKIKSETGAEASKSTKEMIKQKHAQWFVQKYTLDEYNMKILDKSCITLFTSPTNPSTAILKLSNILLDDSHVPYITSMMANNNCPNLIYLDLRDNFLGDYSASLLTASISKGEMSNLKVLHLEGNKLSPFNSNPKIIKLVQNVKQDIKILVSRVSDIIDASKKQGNLFFGSKEDKQEIVKGFLKQAQDNAVDIHNVTVSKDIFDGIKNFLKLGKDFSLGWAKCYAPDSVGSFVGEVIIARVSPLAGKINDTMDKATCYFETFDESASSKEGVQFMVDIGLVEQSELLGVVE